MNPGVTVSPPADPPAPRPHGARPVAGHPALVQLARLIAGGATCFRKPAPPGYKRGVDTYSAAALPWALCRAAEDFRDAHRRYPDILDPRRLSDKLLWSKFFRPMKVPETGNKLLTSTFIPEDARALVACPQIVWHSKAPRVPRPGEIEPGTYYLKASHGADMYRRVTYPIAEEEAAALDREFARHLANRYGVKSGEWWYEAFEPEILLEKAIGSDEFPLSWNFYVIGGEVGLAVAYQKLGARRFRKSYFSPQFETLAEATPVHVDRALPSAATCERMRAAARAIGASLGFVRVDFLLDDDETPYLGEVTFTPGNAHGHLSPALDLRLGEMWDLTAQP